jgi:thioredoxin-dependent peroxiredoxin
MYASGVLTFAVALFSAAGPEVGSIAPDFVTKTTDGVELKLSKLVEKGVVILAFFPKAFTTGCTSELKAYRDRFAEIEAHKATVIAISTDTQSNNAKFKDSLRAPYHFVGDIKLVELFGVKYPLLPFSKRVTFVVGPGLKILFKDEGSDAVNPEGAVAAVCNLKTPSSLDFVKEQK